MTTQVVTAAVMLNTGELVNLQVTATDATVADHGCDEGRSGYVIAPPRPLRHGNELLTLGPSF